MKAIKNDIVIYSAHTNLDNAPEGVNFKIAEKIGLTHVRVLEEKDNALLNLVTSVPDFYPMQNSWNQAGAGVIGELETPETELEFLKRVKKTFEAGCLKHNKLMGREIQTVALCGGAGAFLIPSAIRKRADVFITGEIKYHDYFGHDADILLAEIGHYESEQYTKEIFYTVIRELFPNLALQQCKVNTNPIKYL